MVPPPHSLHPQLAELVRMLSSSVTCWGHGKGVAQLRPWWLGGSGTKGTLGLKFHLPASKVPRYCVGQDSRVLSKAAIPAWIREKTLASGFGDSQGDRDPSYLLQVMAASSLPPSMMWSLPHSPSHSLPECLANTNRERPSRRGRIVS